MITRACSPDVHCPLTRGPAEEYNIRGRHQPARGAGAPILFRLREHANDAKRARGTDNEPLGFDS